MKKDTLYEDYIFNTGHSYERAKQRAGLSRKRADRLICLARKRGMGYKECNWSIDRNYLMEKTDDKSFAVAYNSYCFIFDRNSLACITMYPLPRCFGKKKTFYGLKTRSRLKDYDLEFEGLIGA